MVWYRDAAVWSTVVAVGAVVVSVSSVRVQVKISRDQLIWAERKLLYVDVLREQAIRYQTAGEPDVVPETILVGPDASLAERISAFDHFEARINAMASRQVIDAVFQAHLTASSYGSAVSQARRTGADTSLANPDIGRKEKLWRRAEEELTRKIHSELTFQRYGVVRRTWNWLTRWFRHPTRPVM